MRISDWSSDVCSSDLRKLTGSAAREPTSDIEIVAQTVRYARAAAPEVRAKTILRRLVNDFPDIERSRILGRSEEHTSELQSLMRISYAVFCLKKKIDTHVNTVRLLAHNTSPHTRHKK